MRGYNLPPEIETERLVLRRWRNADREPFAAMCADARVMEFFPAIQTREESDTLIECMNSHIDRHGFGYLALADRATGDLLGLTGLKYVSFIAHFTPAVEIGWRLAHAYWGKGYASEAALACLSFGFGVLRLRDMVAFTATVNLRSRLVMERIGMTHQPNGEFDHPCVADGHPLQRHVLYRLSAGPVTIANKETQR